MFIEPGVRPLDQLSVKTSFVYPRFVTGHEKDSLPLGVKSKSDSPHPVTGLKAQLLHVGVARPVQGIHPRAAQRRSECLQQLRLRKQFILHCGGQGIEFQIEGRIESDFPVYVLNMLYKAYIVKGILQQGILQPD